MAQQRTQTYSALSGAIGLRALASAPCVLCTHMHIHLHAHAQCPSSTTACPDNHANLQATPYTCLNAYVRVKSRTEQSSAYITHSSHIHTPSRTHVHVRARMRWLFMPYILRLLTRRHTGACCTTNSMRTRVWHQSPEQVCRCKQVPSMRAPALRPFRSFHFCQLPTLPNWFLEDGLRVCQRRMHW